MTLLLLTLLACGDKDTPDAADDTQSSSTDSATDDSGSDDSGTDDSGTDAPCQDVTPVVTNLSLAELATMLESKDFELINVHIPYAGDITGTDVSVAYDDVDAIEAYLGGQIDAKAVLYCLTGPMSAQATAELVSRGYCDIYDLPEGLRAWAEAGYPTDNY